MDEIDIHAKLAQIETAPHFSEIFEGYTERAEIIAEHLTSCVKTIQGGHLHPIL